MIRPLLLTLSLLTGLTNSQLSHQVETIHSMSGLPASLVGKFREPVNFQQGPNGNYYVFDRRANSVYHIGSSHKLTQIVDIGPEDNRLLNASSFDLGPEGRFVVSDAPNGRERVQIFESNGTRIGGFFLPGRVKPKFTYNGVVLTGVGSLQFTGQSILMNQPELGGLVTEFSTNGHPFRTFGVLRRTGQETDRNVHLALNSGLPLIDPKGGYYFVFQSGTPIFRKYDKFGTLLFERHIEGPELDPVMAKIPTVWPKRIDKTGRELPLIPPTIQAAAVDPRGNLWIALTVPYLYVYNSSGEKIRRIRLQGASIIKPISLSFSESEHLLVTPGCYKFKVW